MEQTDRKVMRDARLVCFPVANELRSRWLDYAWKDRIMHNQNGHLFDIVFFFYPPRMVERRGKLDKQ